MSAYLAGFVCFALGVLVGWCGHDALMWWQTERMVKPKDCGCPETVCYGPMDDPMWCSRATRDGRPT